MKLIKVITEGKEHYFEENLKIIKKIYAANQALKIILIFVVDLAPEIYWNESDISKARNILLGYRSSRKSL